MYYKVKDATSAVANVDDYSGSSRLLAATTLRNILGTRNLGDILAERESIAREMKVDSDVDNYFEKWAILVLADPGRGHGPLGCAGGEGGGEGCESS